MPILAEAMGAPSPRRVPGWLARMIAGPLAGQAQHLRGASNAKARAELGWAPAHPSVRSGFAEVFAPAAAG